MTINQSKKVCNKYEGSGYAGRRVFQCYASTMEAGGGVDMGVTTTKEMELEAQRIVRRKTLGDEGIVATLNLTVEGGSWEYGWVMGVLGIAVSLRGTLC